MNFDLSDEQTMFKASIERFVGTPDVEARKAVRRQPGGVDAARWAMLAELGLLALPLDAEAGGLGGEPVDCALAALALGKGLSTEPWLECCYWPLRLLDGLERGAEVASGIADGTVRAAVAFAEPARHYRTDPVDVRASRSGDGWTLSGTKTFVLGGESADRLLVTVLTDEGAALFQLDAETADRRGYALVDGSRAAVLTLRNLQIGEDGFLGLIDDSLARAVAETRLMAAAEMVGLAERLFDGTLAYARERRQFGQPIGSFQAIQHRLVDCYAMIEQMRSTLWRAALAERYDPVRWASAIRGAKAFIAERALHIGHEAIQLHGGMGMSDELAVGHAHKRILLLSRLFGDRGTDLADYAQAA